MGGRGLGAELAIACLADLLDHLGRAGWATWAVCSTCQALFPMCAACFFTYPERVCGACRRVCVSTQARRDPNQPGLNPPSIVFPALSVHGLGKACTCAVYYCCGSFRHRYRYFGRTGEKRRDGGSGERHRATYWTAVVPSFCRLNGN